MDWDEDIIIPAEPVKVDRGGAVLIEDLPDMARLDTNCDDMKAAKKMLQVLYRAAAEVMEEEVPPGDGGANTTVPDAGADRHKLYAIQAWVGQWLNDVTDFWFQQQSVDHSKYVEIGKATYSLICAAVIEVRGGLDAPWSTIEYYVDGVTYKAVMPRPDKAKMVPGVTRRVSKNEFPTHCRAVYEEYLEELGRGPFFPLDDDQIFFETWKALSPTKVAPPAPAAAPARVPTGRKSAAATAAAMTQDMAALRALIGDRPSKMATQVMITAQCGKIEANFTALLERTREEAKRERADARREMDEMKERIAVLERMVASTPLRSGERRERDAGSS